MDTAWVTAALAWVIATLTGLVGVLEAATAVFTTALTAVTALAVLIRGWRVVAKELRGARYDRRHESTAPTPDEFEASTSLGLGSPDDDPEDVEDVLFEPPFLGDPPTDSGGEYGEVLFDSTFRGFAPVGLEQAASFPAFLELPEPKEGSSRSAKSACRSGS